MSLRQYGRLAALILAAAAAAACATASAADPNLYFGAKGGVMSSDKGGYGDSWNAGGTVGLHFLDFNKGKSRYGSLSGEIELTAPLIRGDVNPSIGKWSAWTVGAFAVYHSPELNNIYFKGKAGPVPPNPGSSPSRIPLPRSNPHPTFAAPVR